MNDISDQLALERYKYLLIQRSAMNENAYKILGIYQIVYLALCSGQYLLVKQFRADEVSVKFAIGASNFLVYAAVIVGLVAMFLIIGGVAAWMKNREEESDILEEYGRSRRKAVSLRSLFIWYETYMLIIIVVSTALYWWCTYSIVLPNF